MTALPDPLELVVLDLDGTVCSLDIRWREVAGRLVDVARLCGMSVAGQPGVLSLLHEARASDPLAADVLERALAGIELRAASRCSVNAELLAWLAELPRSVPVAVLALNARAAVRAALERSGLSWRVSAVVAREDVHRPKPDPEGLDILIAGHAVDPLHTVLIGDKPGDGLCAFAAGTTFLAVSEIGVVWEEPGSVRIRAAA